MAERDASLEERRPDPNEKLVKIFDSEEESEAMVVKGLLDSAGIESDLALVMAIVGIDRSTLAIGIELNSRYSRIERFYGTLLTGQRTLPRRQSTPAF